MGYEGLVTILFFPFTSLVNSDLQIQNVFIFTKFMFSNIRSFKYFK